MPSKSGIRMSDVRRISIAQSAMHLSCTCCIQASSRNQALVSFALQRSHHGIHPELAQTKVIGATTPLSQKKSNSWNVFLVRWVLKLIDSLVNHFLVLLLSESWGVVHHVQRQALSWNADVLSLSLGTHCVNLLAASPHPRSPVPALRLLPR